MQAAGHTIEPVALPASTRTAAEAASVIGCSVSRIAKSIVFRDERDDHLVIVVTSGSNRVSRSKVERLTGRPLAQADGNFVKKTTGYAIGGVPPAAHKSPATLVLDEDLRQYAEVWAAAGSPFAVFCVDADSLPELTGGSWQDVAER